MRVESSHLGLFVPGTFTLPQNPLINGLPARGVGDLVPARFSLPPQPAFGRRRGTGDLAPAKFSLPPQPAFGMGDMVATDVMYPIPPNSVLAASGLAGCKTSHDDCGCGCGGKCGGGVSGLGTLSTDFAKFTSDLTAGKYMQAIKDPIFGVPVWGIVAGVVVIGYFAAGGLKRRRR